MRLRRFSANLAVDTEPPDAMRVLVVEDEFKTASFLKRGLTENGFIVDVAPDGEEGLTLALQGVYDVLVLDVTLPRRDGWSLLCELRKEGVQTPALFLTARDAVQDRVHGLDLGSDDYLVKPFAFSELVARLRTLLRRRPALQPEKVQVADLLVDLSGHRASRAGVALQLTPQEFNLLSLLARHRGEVLTRSRIVEQVWDMNFDSDANVVDVAIRRLRRKVDDPFPRRLIHTVRGAGYVLDEDDRRGGD